MFLTIVAFGFTLLTGVLFTDLGNLLLQEPAPIHDGSRTGKIIEYTEYCSGNKTFIHENETLPIESFNGVVYLTSKDIDCYKADLNPNKAEVVGVVLNTPTPTISQKIAERDPVIACSFINNCSGQVLNLNRSVCNSAVCCQLNSGWKAYSSAELCKQDQQREYETKLVSCLSITGKTYRLLPEQCEEVTAIRLAAEQSRLSTEQSILRMQQISESFSQDMDNLVNEVNAYPTYGPIPTIEPWNPTPFVLPTPTPVPEGVGCIGNHGWINCP